MAISPVVSVQPDHVGVSSSSIEDKATIGAELKSTPQPPNAHRAALATIAAPVAAFGFVLVAGYQILLSLGIAFSGAAWGGATLTSALRLASAASAVVLLVAALIVLGRAGYWGSRLPLAVFRWGTWILVVGMLLSALANFASPTVGERFFLGPSAVLLALLCLAATRTRAR
jgi:hypothetical protein